MKNFKFHYRFLVYLLCSTMLFSCEEELGKFDRGGEPTDDNTILGIVRQQGELSTFEILLKETSLSDTLAAAGPYTVFAPNNETAEKIIGLSVLRVLEREGAENLPEVLTDSNIADFPVLLEEIKSLLSDYIVVGERLTVEELADRSTVQTLSGKTIAIINDPNSPFGELTVGDRFTLVTQADLIASNGVVHIVEGPGIGFTDISSTEPVTPETEFPVDFPTVADSITYAITVHFDDSRLLSGTFQLTENDSNTDNVAIVNGSVDFDNGTTGAITVSGTPGDVGFLVGILLPSSNDVLSGVISFSEDGTFVGEFGSETGNGQGTLEISLD